jgi:hypothetical protein
MIALVAWLMLCAAAYGVMVLLDRYESTKKRLDGALWNVAIDHGVVDEKRNRIDVGKCDRDECWTCGLLVCPHGAGEHFWKDGCPACPPPGQS